MNFKKFVQYCNKLLKEHPEIGKYTTIYSSDEEGNSFEEVVYNPTVCSAAEEYRGINFIWLSIKKEDPKEQLYCSQCEQPVDAINQKTNECYDCYLENLQKADSVCIN
jgi:hypothetical protein